MTADSFYEDFIRDVPDSDTRLEELLGRLMWMVEVQPGKKVPWLESHRLTLDFDGACRWPWSVYYEQAGGEGARLRGEGDTIREAIDAACRLSNPDTRI